MIGVYMNALGKLSLLTHHSFESEFKVNIFKKVVDQGYFSGLNEMLNTFEYLGEL